jgi:predicted nucleic acid-binding protein
MQYCLDTNVYIEAYRRYYAFDIAPGFWQGIIQLAENQVVCSPDLVYEEILKLDDELAAWAKAHRKLLFAVPDDLTQQTFAEIAELVTTFYEPHHAEKFLSGADPWVIAYARAHQLRVVTQESLKNEQKGANGKFPGAVKIPNICKHTGVQYQDTFAMLREQKIVLRL